MTVLDVALRLAAAGWPIFPCQPNGKAPAGEIVENGVKNATTDLDVITLWWRWLPSANLAVATGTPGPDVLDVDCKAAVDGRVALDRLKQAGLLTGALGSARTPSGGLHVYYRGTRQTNGRLPRHGLDFRSAGGYALVPPSTIDGRAYELIDWRVGARGQALDWQACKRLLDPPRPVQPRHVSPAGDVAALGRWLARQPEGSRNSGLYWACCRAVESGHGADLDVLVDAAVQAGLSEREARKTAESAARRLGAA